MIFNKYASAMIMIAALAAGTGCMTNRSTATPRTAIEEALLSQAAETAIDQLNLRLFTGTYVIDKQDFVAIDAEYFLGYLNKKLIDAGARPATSDEIPDIRIFPTVANGAIDENSTMIGVPEFPVSLPGAGAITIPEAALFKIDKQKGRYRLFLRGQRLDREPRAFSTDIVTGEKYYDRWTLLFVISFRTTDLGKPF